MARFPKKRLKGVEYDPFHLDTFVFALDCDGQTVNVEVEFTCHCFTRGLSPNDSEEVHYKFEDELRAFCPDRFELSKALPDYFRKLGTSTVYLNSKGGFFFWRTRDGQPYLVFFNTVRMSKSENVQIRIQVKSAHRKPGMAQRGQPVRFTTMIGLAAKGKRPPKGEMHHIKRA